MKNTQLKPYSGWFMFVILVVSFVLGIMKVHVGTRTVKLGYDLANARTNEADLMRQQFQLIVKLSKMQNPHDLGVLAGIQGLPKTHTLASNP
jgi:hypothetical protein